MTVKELAMRLLGYIGVTTLQESAQANRFNQPGLTTGDLEAAVAAINGAMQEIFAKAPSFFSQRRIGTILQPPATVTAVVTQSSTAVTLTGYEPWMNGCTLHLPGDPSQNEIVSATELLRPHCGDSGTFQATVWCDAIELPADVRAILEPVEMPQHPFLRATPTRSAFLGYNQPYHAAGNRLSAGYSKSYLTTNKQGGTPTVYFVEGVYHPGNTHLTLYLRLNPMPSQRLPLMMTAIMKPPTVTVKDIIDGDPDVDPLTSFPIDWHESVLLPVALQRFSSHPTFSPQGSVGEIARQHQLALDQIKSLRPQIARTTAIYR